jgi:uncharacterized protein YlzI (FlbEa/FlbD family)
MTGFVEVTAAGERVLVNVDHIRAVADTRAGCALYMQGGHYSVEESYDVVIQKLLTTDAASVAR